MKIIQKDVHVFYENETYHRREKIFGTVSNIRWFFGTSYIRLELEEKLEAEYQKTLIPTKTLNLSEEKGFDLTKEEIELICNSLKFEADTFCKGISKTEFCQKLYNLASKLKQANGEKPEVVNPVGQVNMKKLEKNIIKDLKSLDLEYLQNANDEAAIADTIMQTIKKHINKPRETDKEKPIIEYTGCLVNCGCGEKGKLRFPHIDQNKLPHYKHQMYIACDTCFTKTWAGEN